MIEFQKLTVQEVDSGMFSDVMDTMGYKNQIIIGFLRNIQGIKTIGRARTLTLETIETDNEEIQKGLTFIGEIQNIEILLVKGSEKFAYFGELMTRLSERQGIKGIVIDGMTRDSNYTTSSAVSLPILAKGYSPVDIKGRGRVEQLDCDISIENVTISPNDLIFIDNEAICVIPKEIEAEVLVEVQKKVDEEKRIKHLISGQTSIAEMLKNIKEF